MGSQDRGFSQFLQTAASQFSEYSGADAETETTTSTTSEAHQKKKPSSASSTTSEGHIKKTPSAAEALSSAKFLLDAAVSKLHKTESESAGGNQLDKAKIAAAATDVLEAAKHYGKLDESSQGKYIQKAEDYLHKYGGQEQHHTSTGNSAVHNSKPHSASGSGSENEENKYGKYFKTAEGYLDKYGSQEKPTSTGNSAVHNSKPHSASQSASEDEENKYGKYFKTAEELFKKF